ncbi:MAG: glycosyl transferase family 2 [Alphaproteobacteria bacterium]|nr:MAG: glycosyl transferase family 2 [Alphaproteobacteria bacterium]
MLNIVVPMAGRGQRFVDAGHDLPKPLIPVHGVPMVKLVIANLAPDCLHRFHFLIQRAHDEQHGLAALLTEWAPGCTVTMVDGVTDGAACTVLLARSLIDNHDALMIANCDQYIDADINRYLAALGEADGLIMTMWADHPKWSFVRRDATGRVVQVVEKQVVSNEATVGIYNFRCGRDFVRAADAMIAGDRRVNGEFYVAPAYDMLIAEGARIECFDIGSDGAGMHGIGTPQDLDLFVGQAVSQRAVAAAARLTSGAMA